MAKDNSLTSQIEGASADSQRAQIAPHIPTPHEPLRNSADLSERIRQRAYEIYVARGSQEGRADEDWTLAEEEILGLTGGG